MVTTASGKTDMRSFRILEVHDQNGKLDSRATKAAADYRLVKRHHYGAARSAANKLCNYKKIKGKCVMFIKVKETTQGSPHKELTYKVIRSKRPEPLDLGTHVVEYDTKVKSIKGSVKSNPKTQRTKMTNGSKTKKSNLKKVKKNVSKSKK